MKNALESAIKSGHGIALIYATGIGLLASDMIPTIADAAYFRLMEKNKQKLDAGQITPRQYWTRDAALYYGLNPLYWALVLGIVVYTKGDFEDKLKVAIALVGAGAVVGVLAKNIQEEEKLKKTSLINKKS